MTLGMDIASREAWPSVLRALVSVESRISAYFETGRRSISSMEAVDFRGSMKVLNEDLERTRWNRAHSHFFESAVSLTGGEAELPRVPEVL